MRDYGALARYLAERRAMPFAWGRKGNDCAAFAGGAIKAQTGRDPLAGLRWSTATGAARLIARLGGMEAAVSARLTPIAPAKAHRGDLAGVADGRFGLLLMVVEGETLIGPGNSRAPRSAMIHAWSAEG
jgi:hypothetical protein